MVRCRTLWVVALLAGAIFAAGGPAGAQSAAIRFATSGNSGFDAWRDGFAQRALAQGRNPAIVQDVLSRVSFDPSIVALDQRQPEFTSNIWDYVTRRVTASRIQGGATLRRDMGATLPQIEARFGAPASIILAIWSIESNYGEAALPYHAPTALATLAFEGRRRPQFEGYLLALLEMIERGYAGASELRSSWAGALGQPQFMPDVYLTTSFDWDGDGRRNIWTNRGDTAASIANYLRDRGWRAGEPVFDEVRVPAGFDYALADGTMRPLSDWATRGVARLNGAPWLPAESGVLSQLYLPAGARGPILLLHHNFSVIRRYNASDRYSLAVALIARGIDGRPGLVTPWPTNLDTLTRDEMRELQTTLTALGYPAGVADGQLGSNTRRAVTAFQVAQGMVADGFPTGDVLRAVRARGGPSLTTTSAPAPEAGARGGSAASAPQPIAEPAPGRALRVREIRELQRNLSRRGFPTGGADGALGPQTREAIRAFERDQGWTPTGRATMRVLTASRGRG